MNRKTSSQWEFGELFPAATRQVLSVAEVTGRIRSLLEKEVGEVWVSGEISNLRAQSSGHLYFTLKDSKAQLSCVLFRGVPIGDRAALKDGQRVTVQGEVTVYEPRGQYQLMVRTVEWHGLGALQAAFERLKQKLNAEGLFDAARKRPLPRFPRRLGIVTSPTGAALQDVLHVIGRRFRGMEILLAPCRVQGQGAETEIAAAIIALNAWSRVGGERQLDAILVTRGGGSLEDLWAFNEELVARAIATSLLPVVSGIGHEIDFTIADFVADVRAATPSAAAEVLTAGYVEARELLAHHGHRLRRWVAVELEQVKSRVATLAGRLSRAHPRRRLNERLQRLDDLGTTLQRLVLLGLDRYQERLSRSAMRVAAWRPDRRVGQARLDLGRSAQHLVRVGSEALRQRRDRVEQRALRLTLLSPEQVLGRGYSITLDATTGRILRRADATVPGQRLRTRLHSGEVTSVVASADLAG